MDTGYKQSLIAENVYRNNIQTNQLKKIKGFDNHEILKGNNFDQSAIEVLMPEEEVKKVVHHFRSKSNAVYNDFREIVQAQAGELYSKLGDSVNVDCHANKNKNKRHVRRGSMQIKSMTGHA